MLNRRPRRGSRRSSPRTTNLIRLTHNLAVLLPLCEAIDATFSQFAAASRSLTPYATEFRYPGGPLDPAMTDAEEGLRDAAEIVGLVRQKLSF